MPTCFNKNIEPYKTVLENYGLDAMYFIGNIMETNAFIEWKGDSGIPSFGLNENGELEFVSNTGEIYNMSNVLEQAGFDPISSSKKMKDPNNKKAEDPNSNIDEDVDFHNDNEPDIYDQYISSSANQSADFEDDLGSDNVNEKPFNEKVQKLLEERGKYKISTIPFSSNNEYTVQQIDGGYLYTQNSSGLNNFIPNKVYEIWKKLAKSENPNQIDRYVNSSPGVFEIINYRTTDKQSLIYQKTAPKVSEAQSKSSEIDREVGTILHNMAYNKLIDLVKNGENKKGNRLFLADDFEKQPEEKLLYEGQSVFKKEKDEKMLDAVVGLMYRRIQKQLESKPEGTTAQVLPEQFIRTTERGSTADVLVVFSDGTYSIYDYKFIGLAKGKNNFQEISITKEDAFNTQISDMKFTLEKFYGFSEAMESMIVPMSRKQKTDKNGVKSHVIDSLDTYSYILRQTRGTQAVSSSENFFPVANSQSQDADLNRFINKIHDLREAVKAKKSGHQFQKMNVKDKILRNIANSILVDNSLLPALTNVKEFFEQVDENLEKYTLEETNEAIAFINMYKDLVGSVQNIAKKDDFKEHLKNEKELSKLFETLNNRLAEYEVLLNNKNINLLSDVSKKVGGNIVDKSGKLKTAKKVNNYTKFLVQMSDVNNPLVRTFSKLYLTAMDRVRLKMQNVESKLSEVTKGLTISDFKSLLNEKGDALFSKYDPKYYEDMETAKINEDVSWFLENTTFDRERYRKAYNEKKKALQDLGYSKKGIDSEMNAFEQKYDVVKNKKAYFNKFVYLKEPGEKYLSSRYKDLKSTNPDLFKFYEYYTDLMKELSSIAEGAGERFNYNFIPRIHKKTIERAFDDPIGLVTRAHKDIFEDIKVRSSDESYGVVDENGNVVQKIPLYFSKDWDVAPEDLSMDLGKSLYMFADSVYKYAERRELEPVAISMRNAVTNQRVYSTNMFGNKIKGPDGKWRTEISNANNISTFDKMINRDIYGQSYQDVKWTRNIFGENYSIPKGLDKLRRYYKIVNLGYNPISGAVNYLSVSLQRELVKQEGIFVKPGTFTEATKLAMARDEKYWKLTKLFQINKSEHYIADQLSKFELNKDYGFNDYYVAIGKPEEGINRSSLVAYLMSNTIDENTGEIRLISEGEKSIFDRFEITDEGDITFDGVSTADILTNPEHPLNDVSYSKIRTGAFKFIGQFTGKVREDDKALYSTTLLGNLLMDYRSWMPKIIESRMKSFDNYEYIGYDVGRYTAGLGVIGHVFGHAEANLANSVTELFTIMQLSSPTVLRKMLGMSSDFDLNKTPGLKNYYESLKEEHPDLTEEDFKTLMINKTRSLGYEAAMLAFVFFVLGGIAEGLSGEDDEDKRIKQAVTEVYLKLFRELSFMYNPASFSELYQSPLPVARSLTTTYRMFLNTWDEASDALIGEDQKNDRTPALYFTMKHLPIISQIYRWSDGSMLDNPKEGEQGLQLTNMKK